MVDAVTTLLLPANRISYNKAAGAETKERDLRSYVLGYYKSERNEQTGTSRPVALRDRTRFAVILGCFTNAGLDSTVTLAQVFWFREAQGQPDRFYVTADRSLSVAEDFADFGDDITALKRRLRKAGVGIWDSFPGYGKDFRRKLGIDSDQAMELFHQTVSMKSVGNLNDFVRNHMLEPFDAASWTRRMISHFDDLTKAHDAVRRARTQLEDLAPLLKSCDQYDELTAKVRAVNHQQQALQYFFAERRAELFQTQVTEQTRQVTQHKDNQRKAKNEVQALRERQSVLELERAGHGGDRIGEIERLLGDNETLRGARQIRFNRYSQWLTGAGLQPVDNSVQFAARCQEISDAADQLDQRRSNLQNDLTEVALERRDAKNESDGVNTELRSLRERPSNIPDRELKVRKRLCQALGFPEDAFPFAGELIQVRSGQTSWEGAAERLLRGFGVSMLVPSEHYERVSDWINDNNLGWKLVYYRVPARPITETDAPTERSLYTKLEIKESPLESWLDNELRHRANYECAESMRDFRRARLAVTMAGQIKGPKGRHVKDDHRRIDDRRFYVLGWSNESKIDALVAEATRLNGLLSRLNSEHEQVHEALRKLNELGGTLAKLVEVTSFDDLDWEAIVNRIAELRAEKEGIEQSSGELRRITEALTDVEKKIKAGDKLVEDEGKAIGKAENALDIAETGLQRMTTILQKPECEQARAMFDALAERVAEIALDTIEQCDACRDDVAADLAGEGERLARRQREASNRAIALMQRFRRAYEAETRELDDSMESAPGYRELRDRLVLDDLPRFEADFKTSLNTNAIRDIAGFHTELQKQCALIKDRVGTINKSLFTIDYNKDRYIRLQAENTPSQEIREFTADLLHCTSGALGGDDSNQYSEQKFLEVKAIIERFSGRDGFTDVDRAWTRRVTDVRNWFVFTASECWREDDSEYETYTDSGGKSGGQKEKLAYTILAASLAYQFKLDDLGSAKSKTFRFVVIDEAFGRGSDESTRFALGLFGRLGLQLLIVTPLQKIHVIEPYVSSVGFVDNKNGRSSRLQTLTIEEYRERQIAHAREG